MQFNVSSIQIFLAQFLALYLRKVMLNAANFYLFGIIHTKCKYIYSIGGGFARGGDLPLAQIYILNYVVHPWLNLNLITFKFRNKSIWEVVFKIKGENVVVFGHELQGPTEASQDSWGQG